MSAPRLLAAIALAALTLSSLSGCILLGPAIQEASQFAPVNDRPVVDGPAGWEEFPSCEGGPRDDYVWVDGLPNQELTAAGVVPDCGDTWIEEDGDNFMNVTDYSLTEQEIDAIGAALEASGWEKKWDDFAPVESASAPPVGVGARDYYRDGDTLLLAIEIYHNGTNPISYTAYIDYHSPLTRALPAS